MPETKKYYKGQGVKTANGDYATVVKDQEGTSVSIIINSTGVRSSVSASTLESSFWAGEEPQLWEALSNVAVFEAIQVVTNGTKGLFNADSMNFIAEEVLYEGFLKGYMSAMSFAGTKGVKLTKEDGRTIFDENDFRNALDKLVQVGVILDTVIRLIRKQPLANKAKLVYLLKMGVSFVVANSGMRMWYAPDQTEYNPT